MEGSEADADPGPDDPFLVDAGRVIAALPVGSGRPHASEAMDELLRGRPQTGWSRDEAQALARPEGATVGVG